MPWVGPPCNCYVMLDPQATHNRAWSGEAFTLSKKLPKIEKKFFKGIDILPKAGMLRVSDRGIYRPYVLLEFNLYNLLLTTQQADGITRVPPYLSHLHSSVPGYPPPIMPGTDLFYPEPAVLLYGRLSHWPVVMFRNQRGFVAPLYHSQTDRLNR